MKRFVLLAAITALFAHSSQAETAYYTRLADHIVGRTLGTAAVAIGVGGFSKQSAPEMKISLAHQWPAIAFEANFKGKAIALRFEDDANSYNLYIDSRPERIIATPHTQTLIIDDLSDEAHHVRLEKRTESQYAVGRFLGFYISDMATPLTSPAPRARRIAFYGDSLTVGYGNMWPSGGGCTPEQVHDFTNTSLAFPVLAAKHLEADYQIMAFSGLGLVRNYGGFEHDKYRLPMLMDRVLFDDPTPYGGDFKPQIIHINIGSNDFSTPLQEGEKWKSAIEFEADFRSTYIAFVKKLRAENPDALIIIATPSDANQSAYLASVDAIYETLQKEGLSHIERLNYGPTQDTGCNGHPSLSDHRALADTLIGFLETRHIF